MTRIASVAFSEYPKEVRTRREVNALVEAGMIVDNICLRGDSDPPKSLEEIGNIYRIKLKRKRGSKLRYLFEYGYFVWAAFLRLSLLHLRYRYSAIHIHNMPEILVFSAVLPRFMGAKILLDMHDPMPEIFMSKYELSVSSPIIRILKILERLSISFAHMVITPNKAFKELFVSRGCPPEKIHIIMNTPQEDIFEASAMPEKLSSKSSKDTFDLMYHGYTVKYNGLDVAVKAISVVRAEIPGIRLHIYGAGDFMQKVEEEVETLGLSEVVLFHGWLPLEEIADAIESVDLGIVPNRRTPFTELNFPQRIFEYLCKGKPVIACRTQGILDYFNEDSICYFDPGNHEDLARAILALWQNTERQEQFVKRGNAVFWQLRWSLQKKQLVSLVDGLIQGIDLEEGGELLEEKQPPQT